MSMFLKDLVSPIALRNALKKKEPTKKKAP